MAYPLPRLLNAAAFYRAHNSALAAPTDPSCNNSGRMSTQRMGGMQPRWHHHYGASQFRLLRNGRHALPRLAEFLVRIEQERIELSFHRRVLRQRGELR